MLHQLQPVSLALGAPVWLGFIVLAAAAAAVVIVVTAVDFTTTVAQEAALAPVGQMHLVASDGDLFIPIPDMVDPFLGQKRAAAIEDLPAQF